jgi:succinate-acetate transporter protein
VSVVDALIVVVALALIFLGAFQLTTGRNVIGRTQNPPASVLRASGAMFICLGLVTALNADRGLFGDKAHGLIAIVLAAGGLVFAVWTVVLWAGPARQ